MGHFVNCYAGVFIVCEVKLYTGFWYLGRVGQGLYWQRTYGILKRVDNLYWAESAEFLADEYYREKSGWL